MNRAILFRNYHNKLKRVVSIVRRWIGLSKKEDNYQPGIIPKEHFKRYLPKNPVIVEAGAAHGLDTIEMSKLWPEGIIYAFEPIPDTFNILIENTKNLKNVKCYSLALSDKCEIAEMFVDSDEFHTASSLLAPKEHLILHPERSFPVKIKVETITLDEWTKVNNVNKIDFLWLDVQGNESAVLKASSRILHTVRALHIEVNLMETYEGVPLYPELRQWLQDKGFRVEREELPFTDQGNVFFVRSHSAKWPSKK